MALTRFLSRDDGAIFLLIRAVDREVVEITLDLTRRLSFLQYRHRSSENSILVYRMSLSGDKYLQSFNKVIGFSKRLHIKGTCTNGRITSTSITIHYFQNQSLVDIVDQDKEGLIKLGVLVVLNVLCASNFGIVRISDMKSDIRIQGTKEIVVSEAVSRVNLDNQDAISRVYTHVISIHGKRQHVIMHLLKSVAPAIIPATSKVNTLGAYIIGPRVACTCS